MVAPKLRFKEFSGDWKYFPLEKFFPKIRNGFVGVATPYYVEHGIKYLQGKNIKKGKIDPKGLIYISNSFHEQKKNSRLNTNDIIMVQSGHVGECAVVTEEYDNANCHALIVLSPSQKTKVNSYFYSYFFESDYGKRCIYQIKTGNTIEHVLASEIKVLNTPYTKYEEQTKIANFLTQVDQKIEQLTQKHELLTQYKKGMMQKLFSQKLRFKADDGSEFGAWQNTSIQKCFDFHPTNSYSRALLSENGQVLNIHYGDIHTKYSSHLNIKKEKIPYLSQDVDISIFKSNQFLQLGDLVFADASEDYKDIGKAIEVTKLNDNKIVAGLHTHLARPKPFFALGFSGYLMQTYSVRNQIKKLATGISVLGISKTNLAKIEFLLPPIPEQTKIANFLSSIDQKIDLTHQQLQQAKQWKKGLLQHMFV